MEPEKEEQTADNELGFIEKESGWEWLDFDEKRTFRTRSCENLLLPEKRAPSIEETDLI